MDAAQGVVEMVANISKEVIMAEVAVIRAETITEMEEVASVVVDPATETKIRHASITAKLDISRQTVQSVTLRTMQIMERGRAVNVRTGQIWREVM